MTRASIKFWFAQYSDEELASIGSEFIGRPVRAEGIAQQRLALIASGRRQDV